MSNISNALKEAAKNPFAGKKRKIKRKDWSNHNYIWDDPDHQVLMNSRNIPAKFTAEDLKASDWRVLTDEEETHLVESEHQLRVAVMNCFNPGLLALTKSE